MSTVEIVMTPENSAKYGSRGETTHRMTKSWRQRMRIVAAHCKVPMTTWLERKIEEDEKRLGIVVQPEGS